MNAAMEKCGKILMVDDEPQTLSAAFAVLASEGFDNILSLQDSRDVMPLLLQQSENIHLIVLDLFMPHVSGLELLARINADFPEMPVIVMTGTNDLETAVACMKAGAVDYLVKPVEADRLVSTIRKTLEINTLRSELTSLKEYLLTDVLKHEDAFSHIITRSRNMRAVFQYLEAVAATQHSVMITGETGVGKELIALAVHRLSGRRGEFVAENVAGLDDTMFSDALFGHRKGAFTGAEQGRGGLIARAENGTLFLDEICDLSLSSQVKLLRLLQESTYYALGSDTPVKSNARIVVATNKDPEALSNDGTFRKDLFYRLCSHWVQVPPLRERTEDIPALLDHFIEVSAREFQKKKPAIQPGLAEFLSGYDFPGNVRELESMVFDAMARHESGMLSMNAFKKIPGGTQNKGAVSAPTAFPGGEPSVLQNIFGHFPTLAEARNYMIKESMKLSEGSQTRAASMLGITRQALNKILSKKS
jgi:DNA-binding NtrC family response regulator